MNPQSKILRSLKILFLLSGNRRYSLKEIAEKFDLSVRTIQRYIQTFKNAGFVIEVENGLYGIVKMDRDFKNISELLHFSDEEAYLLTKAIHAVSGNNLLKANLVNKLYALYNFDRVADTVVKPENSENVHKLIKAIKENKQVILHKYSSANSNKVSNRIVEPFDFTINYISFWAFDPQSQSNKLFKTARVSNVEVLEDPYENKEKHQKLPTDVFRISSNEQISVGLELSIRAYNLLIEEFPLAETFCSKNDDKKWTFNGMVCSFDGVGRFVMGLLDEIKVLYPIELKEYLNRKIKKI